MAYTAFLLFGISGWPSGGTYQQFVVLDLLPSVQSTLARYTRFTL